MLPKKSNYFVYENCAYGIRQPQNDNVQEQLIMVYDEIYCVRQLPCHQTQNQYHPTEHLVVVKIKTYRTWLILPLYF